MKKACTTKNRISHPKIIVNHNRHYIHCNKLCSSHLSFSLQTYISKINPPLEMSTPTKEASTVEDEVSADEKEDWIPKATEMVDWLYDFCYQHYPTHPPERISDIEHQISSCIKVLDLIPQEKRQSEHERSTFAYLKGRLYNAVPDVYKEEAERHLEVATNLNPLFLDAWNHLGMCVAKKGDYRRAKNCFEFVLKMDPTSMVLRQLAELELLFSPGAMPST
ncbi:uncharacterized protein LOC132047514 [Lycium ferocissimum]|uniref:uncharacterized protein LOC132047514 n=1 Tax=Lycium ferocissimum TaxID=112874 RepID=UPI00281684BB|nr:uncharacterized protein LOC132047514 [Lycium ferocissimum]